MSQLPVSQALAEATPDSIADLMSRNIETCSDTDIDKIILFQREQRARFAATESAGLKPSKPSKTILQTRPTVDLTPDELDL